MELHRMHKHVRSVVLLFAALNAGCAFVPKNTSQMRESQKNSSTVCSTLAVDEAMLRVEAAWRRCHARQQGPGTQAVMAGGVPVLIPYGDVTPFLRREQIGDTKAVLLGQSQNGNIMMTAEFRKTEACAAEVVSRGWNMIWNSRASVVGRYLSDPEAACP